MLPVEYESLLVVLYANALVCDLEGSHLKQNSLFEHTISMVPGPPGALGLRLCSGTARGREDSIVLKEFLLSLSGLGRGNLEEG